MHSGFSQKSGEAPDPPEKKKAARLASARCFGVCHLCREWQHGAFVREGRDIWLFCERHRVRWFSMDIAGAVKGKGAPAPAQVKQMRPLSILRRTIAGLRN
jgi:hypothetical protein